MIEKRKKRKKIFYVPGMISLVFIPFFCFYHFYKVDAFKVYGGIEIYVADKELFTEYKIATLRKYEIFDFNGSLSDEKQKLNEMKFYLKKLVINKDTINGIVTHFGPKANYDVYVSVVDILKTEKAPSFAPYKDDIYILASTNKSKKNKKSENDHMMTCIPVVMFVDDYAEMEKKLFQFSFFKQKMIFVSFGYFALLFLNIFALVKFNKNK